VGKARRFFRWTEGEPPVPGLKAHLDED
jgi:hypothetical protein